MPLDYGVLVVINDRKAAEDLARRLLELGYRPLVLDHPRQALEAATLHDCCAAILSTDLPEINGPQLARMLKLHISDLAVLLIGERRPDDGLLPTEEEDEFTETTELPCLVAPSVEEIERQLELAVEQAPSGPAPKRSTGTTPGTYGLYSG